MIEYAQLLTHYTSTHKNKTYTKTHTADQTVVGLGAMCCAKDHPERRTLASFNHLDHTQFLDVVVETDLTWATAHSAHHHGNQQLHKTAKLSA